MLSPIDHIKSVSRQTDSILLFHSGAGKDSICLADMAAPYFKRVVCCYMYTVPGLEHIESYINWTRATYGYHFEVLPHYSLASFIKTGYLGIKQDKKQKNYTLATITDRARQLTGIQWAMFGFKQSDSLNRRLMLRTYADQAINYESKKCYPLSEWKNADVMKYIDIKGLPKPLTYGSKHQSSGTAVDDINFLLWCKENHPADLQRIYKQFPETEILVYRHLNNQ